jgi:hypothetical protein
VHSKCERFVEWVFLSGNDKMKFRTNSTQPAEICIALLRAGEFSAWTLWTHNDLCECCETRIVIAVENGSPRFHCCACVSWEFVHTGEQIEEARSVRILLEKRCRMDETTFQSHYYSVFINFQGKCNFNPFYKRSVNLKCGELFISRDCLAKWSFYICFNYS